MKRTLVSFVVAVLAVGQFSASARPAKRLSSRAFTVIAVVDTGVNPYHVDFHRPELTAHPSTYIEGYPRDARALQLSLGVTDLARAREADTAAWSGVEGGKLVWIPGTNIVGAIGPENAKGMGAIFDTNGHGTATASLAGGRIHGPSSDGVLIVVVKGFEEGLQWAVKQPWIDIITNSWGPLLGLEGSPPQTSPIARATYEGVADGKVICFATGNTATPGLHDPTAGPSWIVNVGAASETMRGEHVYTVYPNDILGLSWVKAADNDSTTDEVDFSGTSAASPNACGNFAGTLAKVRAAAGDYREGPHGGGLVVAAKANGYLDDGLLTRVEFEDAMHATAVPAATAPPNPQDPYGVPAAPAVGFLRGGYGIVDDKSAAHAFDVIVGTKPRPDRTLEDAWFGIVNELRDTYWGDPP